MLLKLNNTIYNATINDNGTITLVYDNIEVETYKYKLSVSTPTDCIPLIQKIANKQQEKKRNRNKKYSKIVSKYNDFSSIVDGFSIFVPQNTSLWQKQAEVLNQCIISSNYIDKVVDKSSVLIFIQKNDVPIATVEIGKNNQILQFYCDEHDRQNCKPTEQLRNTFNLWLKDKIFFDKTEKKCA